MMKMSTLIYIQKNEKTLMLLRNKKKKDVHMGKWNGVGGKLETGESPEECALREVYEETHLKMKSFYLNGLLTFPNFADGQDWFIYSYICNDFEGILIKDSPEGELHWIDTDKILDLNLWEGDKIFLKWMIENQFFSAKFMYDGERLKDYSVQFYDFFKK